MKYKAVIFDVSDTLIEYHPNYAKIYGDRIRSLGIDVTEEMAKEISKAVYWAIGEQSQREIEGAPCATAEESALIKNQAALSCVRYPDEMKSTYLHMMSLMPKIKQEMRVIPGVLETLEALKKKYTLGIVSNHHAWLSDRLKALQLDAYFQSIIISEVVGIEKPDVRIMEIALQELNIAPQHCLYVGDHPHDVLCAKKAGMDCAWIVGDWDKSMQIETHSADYHISNVAELTTIL
ncbi:MAG: HAD family hydrolase [Oscillospiraceae bacterium]|jgi:HAD superfamily hydrolase (TIGR01509 family)|nr:HAD family hydrolase [Oscillospiraceae bacterium]